MGLGANPEPEEDEEAVSDDSKATIGSVFPSHAINSKLYKRVEPLITPEQLRRRQLAAIPLVSFFPNPMTGRREEITNDDLADIINRAVADAELQTGLTIFPVQYDDKYPFDRTYWQDYGFTQVVNRPIASVDLLAFTSSDETNLFVVNPSWIEAANFHKGQVNIIPFVPAAASQFVASSGGSGSANYLTFMNGLSWIPALVRIKYTCGFPEGNIPVIINELIGCIAAIEVLGALQSTNINSSYGLGIDGMNQSVSGPGPQIYSPRIELLEKKKDEIIRKLKNLFGLQVTSGWV